MPLHALVHRVESEAPHPLAIVRGLEGILGDVDVLIDLDLIPESRTFAGSEGHDRLQAVKHCELTRAEVADPAALELRDPVADVERRPARDAWRRTPTVGDRDVDRGGLDAGES